MELSQKVIKENDLKILSFLEFIEQYHKGLTKQALTYAKAQGKIDWVKIESRNYVVLTLTTLAYQPNLNINRKIQNLKV